MATIQDTAFQPYAGQLIPSGIRTNQPFLHLEDVADETVLANISKVDGLMPKITDLFVHETKIFTGPIEQHVIKTSNPYGVGQEQIAFDGTPNKKSDGTCMPWGSPTAYGQLDMINYEANNNISIRDREIKAFVLNEQQAGSVIAEKMKTPIKTMAEMKYRAWIQLLSDVNDGSRSISSDTSSTGTGTSVTYAPDIEGYVATSQIEKSTVVLPDLTAGGQAQWDSVGDVVEVIQGLQAVATDMSYPSSSYNKLGVSNFNGEKPLLFIESKVLQGMDNMIMNQVNQRLPTRTASEYLMTFCEPVQIDSFASLPATTAGTYDDYRLGMVLLEKGALRENIKENSVESFRCANERATGWNHQYESIMSIWRGANAHAVLFLKEEPDDVISG